MGVKIILHTIRSDGQKVGNVLTDAVDWLEQQGIKLFAVNNNPDKSHISTSPKTYGHLYIDDQAFGCPTISGTKRPQADWSIIGPEVYQLIINFINRS